uniref:RNase H type-1 domain-containing protein n=1 Tax=Panagrolaimus davidi TaxID=227884 RepID=A0A914Q0M7_9BILA
MFASKEHFICNSKALPTEYLNVFVDEGKLDDGTSAIGIYFQNPTPGEIKKNKERYSKQLNCKFQKSSDVEAHAAITGIQLCANVRRDINIWSDCAAIVNKMNNPGQLSGLFLGLKKVAVAFHQKNGHDIILAKVVGHVDTTEKEVNQDEYCSDGNITGYYINKCVKILGEPYSDRYNIIKSNIGNLLNLGSTRSVFAEGMSQTALILPTTEAQTTLNNWITSVENGIIQNASITPAATKIAKVATELDIFFVQNPEIQSLILYRNISLWVSLISYYFWELSSTPGTSGCKIYDILLDLTKDNPSVQKRIYTKNVPCSISFAMVTRMTNLIYDVPLNQRLYLKTLKLPNGISLNQFLRIAFAYFPTYKRTCDRILKTVANGKYANASLTLKSHMKQMYDAILPQFTPDKTLEDCVSIVSNYISNQLDGTIGWMRAYLNSFWEPPFGSFFEVIIFNDCQISLLISKAPNFYL